MDSLKNGQYIEPTQPPMSVGLKEHKSFNYFYVKIRLQGRGSVQVNTLLREEHTGIHILDIEDVPFIAFKSRASTRRERTWGKKRHIIHIIHIITYHSEITT